MIGGNIMSLINNDCKSGENCKKCNYPCANQGENLKPITIDELRNMGYILCEEYTECYLDISE